MWADATQLYIPIVKYKRNANLLENCVKKHKEQDDK